MSRWYTRDRTPLIILGLILLAFLAPLPLWSRNNPVDEEKTEIPVSLILQGRYAGELTALMPGADLECRTLMSLLEPLLNKNSFLQLSNHESPYVSLHFLRQLGLQADFDSLSLTVKMEVPPDIMPEKIINIRAKPEAITSDTLTSDPFSAYMNYSVSADFLYEETAAENIFSFPARANLMPVFQLYRWVLEGEFDFRTPPEEIFTIEELLLVRDFPEIGARFSAGTVNSYFNGICFASSDELNASQSSSIPETEHIIIDEPSVVEIYLNNRLLKRFRQNQGPLTLADIPYSSGLNSLRIEVISADGSRKVYESVRPFDASLQEPNAVSYSISTGIPDWDWSDLILSGRLYYGLLPWLTLGIEGQTSLSRFSTAFETIAATDLGNVGLSLGLSVVDFEAAGHLGVRYRISFPDARFAPVVGLGYDYKQPNYYSSIFLDAPSSNQHTISLSYGQPLFFSTYLNLGSEYKFDSLIDDGEGSLSASFLARLAEGISLSFRMSAGWTPWEISDWQAGVTITVNPGSSDRTILVNQDVDSGELSMGVSTPLWNLQLKDFPPSEGGDSSVAAGLFLQPGPVNLLFDNSFILNGDGQISNSLRAGASGAVLFAGGRFAATTPVTDSFVMIVAPEEADDLPVRVYGTGIKETESDSGFLVLKELSSYRRMELNLDLPESEPDTAFTDERVTIVPSYRSGIVIRPELRKSYYGRGVLTDASGNPLPLTAARIVPESQGSGDGESSDVELTFTNEEGIFYFNELQQGVYHLRSLDGSQWFAEFAVEQNSENPIELGTVIFKELEKKK